MKTLNLTLVGLFLFFLGVTATGFVQFYIDLSKHNKDHADMVSLNGNVALVLVAILFFVNYRKLA